VDREEAALWQPELGKDLKLTPIPHPSFRVEASVLSKKINYPKFSI